MDGRDAKGLPPTKSKPVFMDSIAMDTVQIEVGSGRQQMACIGRSVLQVASPNITATAANSLSDAGVFLKSYGLSGSATISRRGADPTQTQVLWNSLPINNPMLGMGDFTILMPLGMQVQLLEGGNTSLLGSGSVGGTVLLNSQLDFNPKSATEIHYLYGNLGEQQRLVQTQLSSHRLSFHVTLLSSVNQNKFWFQDPGLQLDKRWMTGAAVNRSLIRIGMGKKWERGNLKMHGEMAEVDRGLGVMLGSLSSLGHQLDRSIKTMVEGNQVLGVQQKVKGTMRLGWVRDYIDYLEGRTGALEAISLAHTLHAQTEWQIQLPKHLMLLVGGDFQWQQAEINAYLGKVNRKLPANFLSVTGNSTLKMGDKNYRLQYVLSSRYEWNENIPTGSFSVIWNKQGSAKKPLQYKLNVHNSFRRPTLNDLYWYIPFGRTTLYSEKGKSAEAGLVWGNSPSHLAHLNTKKWVVLAEATGFYRQLDRPIVWMPFGPIWRPMNLLGGGKYVGLSYQLQVAIPLSHRHIQHIRFFSQGEWVHTAVKNSPTAMAYQQIFIPKYSGISGLGLKTQWGEAQILLKSTGTRYIQTDNLESMKPFQLLDVHWVKNFQLLRWKTQGKIQLSCENLLGITYQTVPNRPMPKQVLRLGITLQWLNSPNPKKSN